MFFFILCFWLIFLLDFVACGDEWKLIQGYPGSSNISYSSYYGSGFLKNNRPGSRYLSGSVQVGPKSVFLFGGGGYHQKGQDNFLCDLWEYNGELNMWQFLKGGLDFGGYNTGHWSFSFDNDNYPSGRRAPFMFMKPHSETRFYLFGGFPFNAQLWEYDIMMNRFKINTGYYYEEACVSHWFHPSNKIPGRAELAGWVNENKNYFYTFGGAGYHGDYNDIWVLDLLNLEWRWIRGPNVIHEANSFGSYGVLGEYSFENDPPSRYGMAFWKQENTSTLYVFGGRAWKRSDFFNDLWSFSMTNETWRWTLGNNNNDYSNTTSWNDNIFTPNSSYSLENLPNERRNMFFWKLGESTLFFGGDKFDNHEIYVFGDLWEYDNKINMFRCLDFCGNWNATRDRLYNPSLPNVINGRSAGVSFKDNEGNIGLFSGFFSVNDLWIWDGNIPKCHNMSIFEPQWLCSGHGVCDKDICSCSLNPLNSTIKYSGDNCQNWECFGEKNLNNSEKVCGGHGICSDFDDCDCYIYVGKECNEFTCFSYSVDSLEVCNFRSGRCVGLDICSCIKDDYYGDQCQEEISSASKVGSSIKIKYVIRREMVDANTIYHYFECSERIANSQEELGKDSKCLWATMTENHHYIEYLEIFLGEKYKLGRGDKIIVKPISSPNVVVKLTIEEKPMRFPFEIFVFLLFLCLSCCYCCLTCCVCFCFCCIVFRNIRLTQRLHHQIRLFNMLEKPNTP